MTKPEWHINMFEKFKVLYYSIENENIPPLSLFNEKDRIYKLKNELKKFQEDYVEDLDPTEQHFNVGDIAWAYYQYQPVEVKITAVQNFQEYTNDRSAYIFYWYEFTDMTRREKWWHNTKFYTWLYGLSALGINQPKIPPEFGPGHGVLAGRNEDIYKTAKECEIDVILQCLLQDLDDLGYFLDEYNNN